jgi:hypothetical protein
VTDRHNADKLLYLCGDLRNPEWFFKAEREIVWLTDYTVVNPAKARDTLLERLRYCVDAADLVVVLPGYLTSSEALTEAMYAKTVGIEVKLFEDVVAPFDNVRDCD